MARGWPETHPRQWSGQRRQLRGCCRSVFLCPAVPASPWIRLAPPASLARTADKAKLLPLGDDVGDLRGRVLDRLLRSFLATRGLRHHGGEQVGVVHLAH